MPYPIVGKEEMVFKYLKERWLDNPDGPFEYVRVSNLDIATGCTLSHTTVRVCIDKLLADGRITRERGTGSIPDGYWIKEDG